MRRHHIRLGDTTTAGGVVVSATSNFSILGRPAAVEGDTVECPACKSTGVISCTGPRHHETFGGRNSALEGDLCACGCPEPPQLVAGEQGSFHTLDGLGADPLPGAAPHEALYGAGGLAAVEPVRDRPWIGFRLDEAASCEGVTCRLVYDDGSHAHAMCMRGNRLRVHGVEARSVQWVEYRLAEVDTVASLTAFLLGRIAP